MAVQRNEHFRYKAVIINTYESKYIKKICSIILKIPLTEGSRK